MCGLPGNDHIAANMDPNMDPNMDAPQVLLSRPERRSETMNVCQLEEEDGSGG